MGVISASQEISSPVAPSRMFKAYILDSPTILPKIRPHIIKSIDFVEGDGGVGSIQQTTFQEGHPAKNIKLRIDGVDKDNLDCKYTMIEGGPLDDTLVSIEFEFKFDAVGTGTVCKITRHFHVKDGGVINAEELMKLWEHRFSVTFKEVEEYILANPDAYA